MNVWWLGLLVVTMLLECSACGNSSTSPSTRSPSPKPTLSAAEQSQLAQLEVRPLKLPTRLANGNCPEAPQSKISPYRDASTVIANPVFGAGPVYIEGGPKSLTSKNAFFEVTYFTDPTVRGVVLVRGQQVDGPHKWMFTGDYAGGPVLGSDVIDGKSVQLYGELALPSERPPVDASAAPGWGIWTIRQAVDISVDKLPIPCTGEQMDTASSSEVFAA